VEALAPAARTVRMTVRLKAVVAGVVVAAVVVGRMPY
jgi:hypothetical protein